MKKAFKRAESLKNSSSAEEIALKIGSSLSLENSFSEVNTNQNHANNLIVAASNLSSRANSPLNELKRLHRVVFTGGPCAGKTTCINRVKNFFENIGWKVFCVPETATHLLSSGIYFYEMSENAKTDFQENLLKTLIQTEDSINEVAKYYNTECHLNVIIIYDRGSMDPLAYCSAEEWEILKLRNPQWNEVDLRDNRYDQIIHMVTAANGAEQFYTLDNNCVRTESIEVARELDEKCSKAWIGHPCMDIIPNYNVFEHKVTKTLQTVVERIGLQVKGFDAGNKKRKFLVKNLPDDSAFPNSQELNVVHNYLSCNLSSGQARIRKSGQSGVWSYSYAIRTYEDGQYVETRTQIDKREYTILSKTIDPNHWTVYQKRRCFLWKNRYYRIDIYEEPCNPSCRGLIILSTRSGSDLDENVIPDFIQIEKEITKDNKYSMFNLSHKEDKKSD